MKSASSKQKMVSLGQLFLILLPLFLLAGAFDKKIAQQRKDYKLKPSPLKPSLDVPSFVGTVLLGGFRALAIDFLWIRATSLQRLGEWWELNTLFELMAYLQPNLEEVWIFNSWNLAYNISVNEPNPGEQWLWIQKSLEFLEMGIEKNGQSYMLPWYMAMIYSHKIPQNAYYERACPDRFEKAIYYCELSLKLLENKRDWFQSIMTLKTCYTKQAHELERLDKIEDAQKMWRKVIDIRKEMSKINPHFHLDPTEMQYWDDWITMLEFEKTGDLEKAKGLLKTMLFQMKDTKLEVANKLFNLQDKEIFKLQQEKKFEQAEKKILEAMHLWQEHHLRAIEFDEGIGFPRVTDFVTLLNQTLLVNQLWQANELETLKEILRATMQRIDEKMQYAVPESMEERFRYFGGKTLLEKRLLRTFGEKGNK